VDQMRKKYVSIYDID